MVLFKRTYKMDYSQGKKRGQVTIFVIISILIVAGVVLFFTLSEGISLRKIPKDFTPVYNSFQTCVKEKTQQGIDILERQGGYIYLPEYRDTVGPFSSWFYFSGTSIPYWSYTQGGVEFEQIPSKQHMENDLETYIQDHVQECSFEDYEDRGFDINMGDSSDASVNVKNKNVEVDLNMDLYIKSQNNSVSVDDHEVVVDSKLGNLYDSAKKIYEKEKQERFLEKYGIDVLRLYAPVDGIRLQCSPLTWNADNVFNDLENALETNIMALSSGGKFQNKNKYFNLDLGIENNARFLNSQNWEHSFEVVPSEGNKLISQPVGNNQALGALGFCYNAYHFVYDAKYPVLIQVYDSENPYEGESFQFPLGVVIKGNKPREPLNGSASDVVAPEVCEYRNTNMTISTYDRNGKPVDSKVSIECVNTKCNLGETGEDGILNTQVPQCVNAQLVANAKGFKTSEMQYSTLEGGSVNLILRPLHKLDLEVLINGREASEYSEEEISRIMIYFDSEEHSQTLIYPQEKTVSLAEGEYSVEVYVYGNASMSLHQSIQNESIEYCLDVSHSIAGSIPGQKCFEVDSPDLINSNALVGGGKKDYSISNSKLQKSDKITLRVNKFETPDSLGGLQRNYELLENKQLKLNFS